MELIAPSVIVNCFQKAGFLDGETTGKYEFGNEDDWKSLQRKMVITALFEKYVLVDDEVVLCEILSNTNIYEMTEGVEMSKTDEDVEMLTFLETIKGLETFWHLIKIVENVPEEVFKSLKLLSIKVCQGKEIETKNYDQISLYI